MSIVPTRKPMPSLPLWQSKGEICGITKKPDAGAKPVLAGALWRDVVVGLGLPQVLELVARSGARDLWRQAPSAWRRARAAAAALGRARAVRLDIADPESAAEALVVELRRLA